MKDSVKILLLGDERVGKSSLISSFVSQCFSEKVPPVHTPVQIPPSESLEQVTTIIIDSSSTINEQLRWKIRETDAIILVYDHGRRETLNSLGTVWLPLIQDVWGEVPHKPVVLAGNKHDLKPPVEGGRDDLEGGGANVNSNRALVQTLLERFRFVLNNFDECSAKTLDEVPEVFVSAQKFVLYPVWPLYDMRARELTPKLRCVLGRIFRLFDLDRDGLLSDSELMALQERCFRSTLQAEDVEEVRKILGKNVPEGVQGPAITPIGLEGIVRLFIEQMQVDMPWTMLRMLGYSDALDLKPPPGTAEEPPLVPDTHTAVELSDAAMDGLFDLHQQFATPGVGLQEDGLQEIFNVLPEGEGWPWDSAGEWGSITCLALPLLLPRQKEAGESTGGAAAEATGVQPLEMDQWLALWQMVASVNPEVAVRHLRLLGVCCSEGPVPPIDRLLHVCRRWRRPSATSSSSGVSTGSRRSSSSVSHRHKRSGSSSSSASSLPSHNYTRARRRVVSSLLVNCTNPQGSSEADQLLYTLCGLTPPSRPSPTLAQTCTPPTGLRAGAVFTMYAARYDPEYMVIIEACVPPPSDPSPDAPARLLTRVKEGGERCDGVILVVDGRSSESVDMAMRVMTDGLSPRLPVLFLLKGGAPPPVPTEPPSSPTTSSLALLPDGLRELASRVAVKRVVSLPSDPLLAKRELDRVGVHMGTMYTEAASLREGAAATANKARVFSTENLVTGAIVVSMAALALTIYTRKKQH